MLPLTLLLYDADCDRLIFHRVIVLGEGGVKTRSRLANLFIFIVFVLRTQYNNQSGHINKKIKHLIRMKKQQKV